MKKKIKIFDYCWHIPHQWDMINALREDCEFYYGLNVKQGWDTSKRPLPPEVKSVTHYQPGIYDVALLHIDQQSVDPFSPKNLIYNQFNETIKDIPKIVMNHGTPVYYEYYRWTMNEQVPEQEMEKWCVDTIPELVGDNMMVVNSHASASEKEWGFGYPIVHGMDPGEWYDLPKEPRVFTAMSPGGFDAYYNRACVGEVADELYDRYGHILQYARLNVDVGETPEQYKTYLGKSLIYIDISFRTPMNRARTEAFLSGCCVVQIEGAHDLERWAKPGENIVIVPNDPVEIARVLADILDNGYTKALAIGQAGRKMAMKHFSRERYRGDWMDLLDKILR